MYCRCLLNPDDAYFEWPVLDVLEPQSGDTPLVEEIADTNFRAETVEFLDQNPAWHMAVDSERDPSFDVGHGSNADLGDFFSRAVEIKSFDWGTGVKLAEKFNPWQLFFENPRVANRLANYYSLRCDLKLKFLINGNGFWYGRLLAAYKPLIVHDALTQTRTLIQQDLIAASQRPHIFLDPTTNLGGEMTLPYFFYKNGVCIPDREYVELGEIDIWSMANLYHANGDTGSVRVTVLAWAENVTVSMPTEATWALTPQSGELLLEPQAGTSSRGSSKPSKTVPKTQPKGPTQKNDEYGSGPVSYPASIVAKAAGALANAPIIGPYARATQIAAGAMGNVAKIFGYSRPASVEPTRPYVPQYAGNMASTNMIDTSVKLSTDAKQEVTIDPTTFGLASTDEMTIKSIAGRESYLTQVSWRVDDGAGDVLFNSAVTPFLWDNYQNGTNTEVHMPAACFAAAPFRNWRGAMEFRFQVVSSAFHKGRLALHWDPYKVDPSELNVTYSRIIDIGADKDFVMRVKWGQLYPYCGGQTIGQVDKGWRVRSTLPQYTSNTSAQNGFICLRVLNPLTVPNSTVYNDIKINVFVRMCEDFEVANPDDYNLENFTFFKDPPPARIVEDDGREVLDPQSGEDPVNATIEDETDQPSKPTEPGITFEVGGTTIDGGLADICFGEVIPSFRSLLKRYNFHTSWPCDTSEIVIGTMWRQSPNFPYMRGYAPYAVNSSEKGSYNYCKMTLLNYVTAAYTAYRGALRWKHMLVQVGPHADSNQRFTQMGFLKAERIPDRSESYATGFDTWSGLGNSQCPAADMVSWNSMHSGAHVTPYVNNPVVEVEYPHQSQLRFFPGKSTQITDPTYTAYVPYHKVSALISHGGGTAAGGTHILDFVAAGEDFSLHFFTGSPIVYVKPVDPIPSVTGEI